MLPAHAPRSRRRRLGLAQRAARGAVATTRADGADLDGQQRALAAVTRRFAPQAARRACSLAISGAGVFAVESRAQIKAEVERLAIAGSVVIVVLLLVAFGRCARSRSRVLPVATGVLAGIAAVSLGFGQVHGVTLGFGTTLIGEAVDYAIYYLIQARAARRARAAARLARTGCATAGRPCGSGC